MGVHRLLARPRARHAADARRRRTPSRDRRGGAARLREHAAGATTRRRRRAMTDEMHAIVLGVHVLDVLVRPVEEIPKGQEGALVEEIKMTAAGSAGGAALILSR